MKDRTKSFIDRARAVHGDRYSYDKTNCETLSRKVTIICKIHGEYIQSAQKHLSGQNCPICSPAWTRYDTETFISKSTEKHGDTYDYSKSVYIDARTKIEIICKKHGSFWQIPRTHFLNGYGCKKCAGIRVGINQTLSNDQFLAKAKESRIDFNDFDFAKTDYKTAKTKVIITCNKHGDFNVFPDTFLRKGVCCPSCSDSKGEVKVKDFLKKLGLEFESEKAFNKCKKERVLRFDFYIPDYNLLIEYQGEQHYQPVFIFGGEDSFKKTRLRDQIKRDFCQKTGIYLLEIKYNSDDWREEILTAISVN